MLNILINLAYFAFYSYLCVKKQESSLINLHIKCTMILQRKVRYRPVLSKICVIAQAIKFSALVCRCNSDANFRVGID